MYNKNQLCERIQSLHPDIGEYGININVDFSSDKNAWVVNLKKDKHSLKTYLELEDANVCMGGQQCVVLGIKISKLKNNIKNMKHS